MIKRLKKSFVTITMISAALVLTLLMGVVNLTNAVERAAQDREILAFLAENGGRFPEMGKNGPPRDSSGELAFSVEPAGAESEELRPARDGFRHMTPETPYETRYYSVLLTAEGEPAYADTAQVAAITEEEAEAAAAALFAAGKTSGRTGNYRYTAVDTAGGILYIFLDCTRSIAAVRSFFINSVIVTAAGLLVLLGLSWLLSGRAVHPIAESYEKQKSFITNAGHELKTPLAVIESSTEVIELESGESHWTQAIHGQVKRLSELTKELVSLARMDEGAPLDLRQTDISKTVRQALEPYGWMAEQAGYLFTADIAPDITGRADAAALEKICCILADNALKYTSPGGEILFTLRREGGRILLREENPAEGLERGKQEKFFDRFYRGDASRSGERPGYGLGLSLARALTEAMGGRIQAVSPDGERLVVTVQL